MTPLVRVKFGSHLYGTATPASDLDFKGVHVPDARSIILQRAHGVIRNNTKADSRSKNSAEDVDDESFALHKYLGLVALGDMMATELLFAPEWSRTHSTPEWEEVLRARPRILNRQCKGFVGYCRKQAAKYGIKGSRVACARDALAALSGWDDGDRVGDHDRAIREFVAAHEHTAILDLPAKGAGGVLLHWEVCGRKLPFTVRAKEARGIVQKLFDNYGSRSLMAEQNQGVDWKAVSHAVRVAEQSIEMLRTGRITFPRPNADALLRIKLGERPYRDVAEELERLLDVVEVASDESSLLDETDEATTDALVLNLYGAAVGR